MKPTDESHVHHSAEGDSSDHAENVAQDVEHEPFWLLRAG